MADDYDRIYQQADYFGGEPSPLLVDFGAHIPTGARVLDIGAGQGRNCLPLARRGCRVTALDPSQEALDQIQRQAQAEKLDLQYVHRNFVDFEPERVFDVILCFGLMQILRYQECASLVSRLHQWLRGGGLLFLTAWHVEDPSFKRLSREWEHLGTRCFRAPDGEGHRLYLEKGEIRELFFRWQAVHYWEGLGPAHSHGDGPEERHGDIEVVLVRP